MQPYRFALIAVIPLIGVLAAGACSKSPAPKDTNEASTPGSATRPATEPAPVPAAMPAHASTTPPAAGMPPDGGGTATAMTSGPVPTATGKVIETMDSGGYTYVRLDTGKEKIWAATAPLKVKVGQELTVPLEMPMRNFHSSTLNRDFAVIYFASRVSRGDEPLPPRPAMPTAEQRAAAGPAPSGQAMPPSQPMPAAQTVPPGHPPIGAASSGIKVTEVIAPPSGGRSIADVWKDRTALSGKTVVVRGKVVKFLSGIMGRNWIHLQDGTGDAKNGTNDLTVTTDGDAKPGDVVTASGTLAIDKDFGAGYKYGAIVEGATLTK